MLEAEGCVDTISRGKQRREIPDQHNDEVEVQVQQNLYQQLKVVLVECRRTGSQKTTNRTTEPQATAKTTPTTASSPTTLHSYCDFYTLNLTEGWRQDHKGSNIKPLNGTYNCDISVMILNERQWFRFSGAAGNQLMNSCVPGLSCGTHISLWSDDLVKPINLGVPVKIYAYGSNGHDCRWYTVEMSVMRCGLSPPDYVYRYDGVLQCSLGFCGMTAP